MREGRLKVPRLYPGPKQIQWLAAVASLAVIVVYAIRVFPLSLNIPFRDDFQDILIFVVDFYKAHTITEAAHALLSQHADHLTYSSRIIYYLVFLLEGKVDFRTLTYLSHIGLLCTVWLLFLQTETSSPYKPLVLVCLCLLLFQPRAFGLVIWPMACFQWYFSYCYVLASLYFLCRDGPGNYAAAVITAVLASFTMSTGQLVWFIGIYAIVGRRKETAYPLRPFLTIWLATAIVTLGVFHAIYASVIPARDLFEYALNEPFVIVQAFFALMGSALGMGDMLWSQVLGAGAFLISAGLLVQGVRRQINAAHLFLVYCMGTIGVIVLSRAFAANAFEVPLESVVLVPRYSIASIMLWAILFVLFVNQLRTVNLVKITALIVACAALNAGLYVVFMPALKQHQLDRINYFNRVGMTYSPRWPTKPTLQEAARLGIYYPPERPYQTH